VLGASVVPSIFTAATLVIGGRDTRKTSEPWPSIASSVIVADRNTRRQYLWTSSDTSSIKLETNSSRSVVSDASPRQFLKSTVVII
jgi:hypothetical protein